jgi:hypothetical protein
MLKLILGIIFSLGVGATITAVKYPQFFGEWHHEPRDPGHATVAPEIDPAGAMSGLTLLLGGLAVVRGRNLKQR